jgi:hypothetical protein
LKGTADVILPAATLSNFKSQYFDVTFGNLIEIHTSWSKQLQKVAAVKKILEERGLTMTRFGPQEKVSPVNILLLDV